MFFGHQKKSVLPMFLAFDIYRSTTRQVVFAHLDAFSIESGEVSQRKT